MDEILFKVSYKGCVLNRLKVSKYAHLQIIRCIPRSESIKRINFFRHFNLSHFEWIYIIQSVSLSPSLFNEIVSRLCKKFGFFDHFLLKVRVNDRLVPVDRAGSSRILKLVTMRLRIEETLSVLSTLGGAFSSLGEKYIDFALKAGEISIKQLSLALMCGDPNLLTRCAIYVVYSYSQRGKKKASRYILRKIVHPFLSRLIEKNICDSILVNMYKAACFKVSTMK